MDLTETPHAPAAAGKPVPVPGRTPVRTRWLSTWALVCVVAVMVALWVGTRVRSPLDEAITNATSDQLVTAVAQTRSLARDADALGGTVKLGTTFAVPAPAGSDVAVVTRLFVKQGQTLRVGDALANVSGRPMIALKLPFALYRSLAPGDSGDDVQAVQDALLRLGLLDGTADGEYGAGTAEAVAELYRRAGAEPPSAAANLRAAADDARDAVDDASRALAQAADALDAAPGDRTLRAAVTDAGRVLARAQTAAAEARQAAATPLALGEVVVLPAQKVEVVSVASVGTVLTGGDTPVATLRTGRPAVVARAAADQADAFAAGTKVTLAPVGGGETMQGTVASVGEFDTGSDTTDPGMDVTITFDAAASLEDGTEVTVTTGADGGATSGLTVPLLAIRDDAEGTYVTTVGSDGTQTRAPVTVGETVDGYALITGDAVHDGDTVVVSSR